MAAHRMRREGTLPAPAAPRRRPWFVPGARALTGHGRRAAALLLVLDVHRCLGEQRAAGRLAVSGEARDRARPRSRSRSTPHDKRSVRLDIAEERANEIQTLTKNGETIDNAELNRLANQTAALAKDAQSGIWDPTALAKLQDVSEKSSIVLEQAAPHVAHDAAPALAHAVERIAGCAADGDGGDRESAAGGRTEPDDPPHADAGRNSDRPADVDRDAGAG